MIFRDRKFAPLFWTQFLGALNDNLFKNALVLIVTYQGVAVMGVPPHSLVALAGGVFVLPFFLFSPIAGQLSDKLEKSNLVRFTKWWELAVMALAAVGFYTDSFAALLVVLFFMGMQSTFFGPMKYSMIPQLVPEKKLVTGNAYIETGTFIAILLGTIAGSQASKSSDFEVSAGIIGVALAGLVASYWLPKVEPGDADIKVRLNPIPTVREYWHLIQEKNSVFNTLLAISWFWFFGAAILSVLPVYCKDVLWVDQDVVTLFLAMFTVGVGAGTFVCDRISRGRVELGLVPLGALGMTVFLADISFVIPTWPTGTGDFASLSEFWARTNSLRLVFDFFMMSVSAGVFTLPLYTLIQKETETAKRSRVIAALNIINALFMVLASVMLMALYAADMTTQQIFAVLAAMNIVAAVYIYFAVPEFTLRFYSWLVTHILYKLKVRGAENIPVTGGAIIASNHVSFIDWLILAAVCPRPPRFVIDYDFYNIPIVIWFMRQARCIPIAEAKRNPELLKRAMDEVAKSLAAGELIIVFPEGGLSSTGGIRPFKPGLLRMLERTPVPVIPVALRGLWGSILSRKAGKAFSTFPNTFRREVEVVIAEPVPPTNFRLEKLESIIGSMV